MKQQSKQLANALVLAGSLALAGSALAQSTTINTFDNFNMSGLFGWSDATVVSGPTSYSITDTGYGSGYFDINPNINAAGGTTLEVTLSLSGVGAEGLLGPIVALVDGDGTFQNVAWYGQSPGSHVLTADLTAFPALDLATLDFFHLQLDPSSFVGSYTVEWQNMRITTIPEPSMLALLAIGAAGLFVARRRRR